LGEGCCRAAILVGKVVLKGLDVTTRAAVAPTWGPLPSRRAH
jgi:hypothetical protein